ncbi:hypothetical protein GF380_05470, partial [Candidatus Uhrbacteria bacterium]|nr:hypothetical protein [Candidatus Uhrbacteria bacterium]
MPKDIGQSKKSSGTRSYSFSGTVWATETEWHRWRMQRDKVQNMTGERLGLLLFRSTYLGNLMREAALMQDKDVDDVIAFIQQNLLEASSGT